MAARRRTYVTVMSLCLVLAWAVIWRYSRAVAVAMLAAGPFIAPFAVIIADAGTANCRQVV